MRPFLSKFEVTGASQTPLGPTFVGCDGLIYREGAFVPLFDELGGDAFTQTTISAAREDFDPDRVRCTDQLSTLLTEAGEDEIDPDRIGRELTGQLETLVSRGPLDPTDPDRLREYFDAAFATLLTKAEHDPSDPDRIRDCL